MSIVAEKKMGTKTYGPYFINGVGLTSQDFGNMSINYGQNSTDSVVRSMKKIFISKPASQEILQKYGITEEKYYEICDWLKDFLSEGM